MDALVGFVSTDSDIKIDTTLVDLGIDSLSTVELRNKISSNVGVTLSNDLIMSNPSVGSIEQAILSEVQQTA